MQIKREIYYKLPPKTRLIVRKILFFPIDFWNTITNKRNKYEPLKGDIYIGSGDFITQGEQQLSLLKEYVKLNPNNAVLDIGCGIGRTAVALTKYLNSEGSYEGFDVVEKGINWCTKKIKKDFPNFNFKYVPLNNDLYNNNAKEAIDYKFPYKDNSFDSVFLFSVFTHMSIEEIAHYLYEIKRVLKPGGLCLSTYFIYTSKNEKGIADNKHFSFPINKGNYRLMNDKVKSANIAIRDVFLNKLISDADLIKLKTIDGFWKENIPQISSNNYQDIVILKA